MFRFPTWRVSALALAVAATPLLARDNPATPPPTTRPLASIDLPSLHIDAPDPSAIRDGEWWYVFTTGAGINVRRTRDFVTFERLPTVFREDVPAWGKALVPRAGTMWAPDIGKLGDRYYLVYSLSSWGSQQSAMGFATTPTLDPADPRFEWTDHGLLLDSVPGRDNFNAIDGALVNDASGAPWLVWGSYWDGIFVTRLDPETGRVIDPAQRTRVADEGGVIEGPQIAFRDGWYYLFASYGEGVGYHVRVGRSREITGPYLDRQGRNMVDGGGTALTTPATGFAGPGHHGLALGTPRGDLLLCHVFSRFSRDLHVAPLHWMRDGWPVAGEPQARPGKPLADLREHLVRTRWVISVDGANIGHGGFFTITLRPDGTLRSSNAASDTNRGRWTLEGDELSLHWPNPSAPGGAWIDTMVVAPDGSYLAGRNQRDLDVRGVPESTVTWPR